MREAPDFSMDMGGSKLPPPYAVQYADLWTNPDATEIREPADTDQPADGLVEHRMSQEQFLQDVIGAGRGTGIVYTDTTQESVIQFPEGVGPAGTQGLKYFGDGAERSAALPEHFGAPIGSRNPIFTADGKTYAQFIEGVSFLPATEPVYQDPPERQQPSRFWKRKPEPAPISRQKVGEKTIEVTNLQTGQPEVGVYFDYGYTNALSGLSLQEQAEQGIPVYREVNGARPGNAYVTRTLLPASIAAELREAILADPEVARDAARLVGTELGGYADYEKYKPPYDQLSAQHRIHLIEQQTDESGRNILVAMPIEKHV